MVLNKPMEQSIESEFTEDLLAILHHFSCRMHGRRSHQGKKDKNISEPATKVAIDELVRSIEIDLQSNNQLLEFTEGTEDIR